MIRPLLRISIGAVVLYAVVLGSPRGAWAQQSLMKTIAYEDHNQVEPKPIKLDSLHGMAQDGKQAGIPSLLLGLFTEKDHRLVAVAVTDAKGRYAFPQVPRGDYRLIAESPGFCTANVPVRMAGGLLHWQKSVELHMSPGGIDKCSFGATN